ncbi:MAG: hypothetical protein VB047_10900 [Anaerotignum propionicum]|uniref:hypothetical protein n=1 Tax=Anaerotignum propionicum TaxID=28446 RepID=UPI002B1EF44B|nr:hypothetical protein [Anaerotignum propionicum]MEA5058051.1 hypothetical protein [Anaerotignum propionicum]
MDKSKDLGMIMIHSFVADYRDRDNNYFHSVHQIMGVGEHTDEQVIAALKVSLESKGYIVIFIVEILGQYSLGELQRIVDDPVEADFLNAEPRYINVEEARKVVE